MLPNIYLLQGAGAVFWNKYQTFDVSHDCVQMALAPTARDLFVSGDQWVDTSTPERQRDYWNVVQRNLAATLADKSRPALIFGILNGRTPEPALQPTAVAGNPNDLRQLMLRVIEGCEGRSAPVEMFLLVAQKYDDLMHEMVPKLPRGSVVAVAKTTAESRQPCDFWKLMQEHSYLRRNRPEAHNLLATWLMTGTPSDLSCGGLYVSGLAYRSPRQLWKQTHHAATLSPDVDAFIERMAPYCTEATIEGLNETASAITSRSLPVDVPGESYLHYGLAILNEWNDYIAPVSASRTVAAETNRDTATVSRPARTRSPDTTPAEQNAPVTPSRKPTRLTPGELAGAPALVRRLAITHPAQARKLLR